LKNSAHILSDVTFNSLPSVTGIFPLEQIPGSTIWNKITWAWDYTHPSKIFHFNFLFSFPFII